MPIKLGLTARLFRGKKKKRKKALKLGIIRISEEMVARFGSWRWDLAQACTPASWEVRDRPLVAGPCLSWVASPEVSQTPATVLGALFKPTLGAFALFLNGAAMGLLSSSIIVLSCPILSPRRCRVLQLPRPGPGEPPLLLACRWVQGCNCCLCGEC